MDQNKGSGMTWLWGLIVIIVIIGAVWYFTVGKSSSPASATSTSSSGYVSSTDGFSVNFPGTPDVTMSTFASPTAGSIPLTEYRVTAATSPLPQYYTVYVYHYPSGYQFTSDYLNTALQSYDKSISASYPGSAISSQAQVQFQGAAALTAMVNIPIGGQNTSDYVLLTTHGHNAYLISTYGVSQNDYSTFLDSFTFTQ